MLSHNRTSLPRNRWQLRACANESNRYARSLLADIHSRSHSAQPHRCLADVPILPYRRLRQRLAPGPSGQPRRWWCRPRLHGSRSVLPEGRITPNDLGIWKDDHIAPLARIVDFLHGQGAHSAIQLAHAGRKASMQRPWEGERLLSPGEDGWTDVAAPSPIAFNDQYAKPHELDATGIARVTETFAAAARRALAAGFDVVEIHSAYGYLLHEFLSPLSNRRTDRYGGSFENRTRLLVETIDAIRAEWPQNRPLFVRISAVEWTDGGWDLDQSVALARVLKQHGVDLVDVSSGSNVSGATISSGSGYQAPFAERIRSEANIATAAVGQITSPAQADQIIRNGQADLVLLAREILRDPYWPLHAAQELGVSISWPAQYLRAAHRSSTRPPRTRDRYARVP
jgi:2,4-dienoyl-CoA reductase-like NADH-dependent reductase (Old Yellow Enzyme family)